MPSAPPVLPLLLSVKAANWRTTDDASGEADDEFALVRRKALQRDGYTCRFCTFKAPKWQEVHHLNDDHSDNRLPNLVTACMFCHLCQHIGLAGRNREATLAWIPEIPQDQLNHVMRAILVVERWAEQATVRREAPNMIDVAVRMAGSAKSMRSKLMEREADAERLFRTHDPSEMANALLAMPDSLYEKRGDFLKGLRLLPLGRREKGGVDKMPEIVDVWMGTGGSFAPLPPPTWVGILRNCNIG
jgi:intracellular multiplication protein IcmJ